MGSVDDADIAITGLYDLLLRRLEHELRAEAPNAIAWIERLAEGNPTEYFEQHPDVWPRTLRSFDAKERRLLSALLDVQFGLDSVRFYSERSLAATNHREIHMAMTVMPVLVERLLERMEHLIKQARRAGLVDEATESAVMVEVARYRNADSFLSERGPSAHGAYVSEDAWLRTPEKNRLWELAALTTVPKDPMAWTYQGDIDPEIHTDTRGRLAAIEATMGRALGMLLSGLRPDDE